MVALVPKNKLLFYDLLMLEDDQTFNSTIFIVKDL